MSKIDKNLYDASMLKVLRTAEEALQPNLSRIQEIKNFARRAGIKRIGIAYCMALTKEAEIVKTFLSDEFEVYAIDCKQGQMSKKELLGIEKEGIACNPAAQAKVLKQHQTELNIMMGLCVGPDLIFNQLSAAPVTVLVVKDRLHKHNPIEGIHVIAEAATQ